MITLILIGKPESLHIPYFAMPSPQSKESSWHYPKKKSTPLSQILGGNACRWIIDKQRSFDIRRISTRNYIPRQTAFYANWLIFFDADIAKEFVNKFPHLNIENQLKTYKEELSSLESKLAEKTSRGAYDLSRYPADQRLPAAQRYIDINIQSRDLAEYVALLETAINLREGWESLIDKEITDRNQP